MENDNQLVSAAWLKNNIHKDNLVILDASPIQTVTGTKSKLDGLSIPKARIFDIKGKFSDKTSQFPNTVPSSNQFEIECQTLGINTDDEIIVYDNLGIYTSPRVWWLFKVMGHKKVKVLDGGLPNWINEGFETSPKPTFYHELKRGNFISAIQEKHIISYHDIIHNIEDKRWQIIDARSEGRFSGVEDEPRKHLKSGCIPNSINIPYKAVLNKDKMKSSSELVKIFSIVDGQEQDLVFSCGSGLTACIVMLAYEHIGGQSMFLFDGSWTEYAERQKLIKS